jgi:hypothetical protein
MRRRRECSHNDTIRVISVSSGLRRAPRQTIAPTGVIARISLINRRLALLPVANRRNRTTWYNACTFDPPGVIESSPVDRRGRRWAPTRAFRPGRDRVDCSLFLAWPLDSSWFPRFREMLSGTGAGTAGLAGWVAAAVATTVPSAQAARRRTHPRRRRPGSFARPTAPRFAAGRLPALQLAAGSPTAP